MACGICGDILDCNHSDEARQKYGYNMLGGKECPNCQTDFCEYHFQIYRVGSKQWKQGCPYCVNSPEPDAHLHDCGELSPEFLKHLQQIIPEDEIERIEEFEHNPIQFWNDWNDPADDYEVVEVITVSFDIEKAITEGKEDPKPITHIQGLPLYKTLKQNEEEKQVKQHNCFDCLNNIPPQQTTECVNCLAIRLPDLFPELTIPSYYGLFFDFPTQYIRNKKTTILYNKDYSKLQEKIKQIYKFGEKGENF